MSSRGPEILTIDGPAGVGKSTLALRLAEALGVACLDTGAMFRTLALRLAQAGFSPESDLSCAPGLEEALQNCAFALEGAGEATVLLCNGAPVGDDIRSEEAGMMAANIGRCPEVRAFLKRAQQDLGARFSLVAEGRDMGTAVFPGALCKVFLEASPEVRAERRFLQLRAMGQEADPALLAEQIRLRDEQDRNRAVAPLRAAEDALIIDTSAKSIDEVFEVIMSAMSEARATLPPDVPMRRKKRAISREEAVALLERAEYGTLAMNDESGWPYAVPLSFVWLDGALYFHSAREGRKAAALALDGRACFSVVGRTEPVYDGSFSTYFESVAVFGRVRLVEDADEKYRALWALALKSLPGDMDKADRDIRRSFERTALYRLSPGCLSGKAKRMEPHGD